VLGYVGVAVVMYLSPGITICDIAARYIPEISTVMVCPKKALHHTRLK